MTMFVLAWALGSIALLFLFGMMRSAIAVGRGDKRPLSHGAITGTLLGVALAWPVFLVLFLLCAMLGEASAQIERSESP